MGPASMGGGEAPGGLVLQVYDSDGQCLNTTRLPDPEYATRDELASGIALFVLAAVAHDEPVSVVVYDGSTGKRLS